MHRGSAKTTGGSTARRMMPGAFAVALLAALWLGPLPALSAVSFSAHMVLHLLLILVAAPLLALALTRADAKRTTRFGPGAAFAIAAADLIIIWTWHIPQLHVAAALRPGVFALQQASFLAVGMLVWLPGLSGRERRAAASGAIATGASFAHMTMLGVLLAMAPEPVYPPGVCGGAFGLEALSDQRLGGVLMAGLGGFTYLAAAVVFMARFIDMETRQAESRPNAS